MRPLYQQGSWVTCPGCDGEGQQVVEDRWSECAWPHTCRMCEGNCAIELPPSPAVALVAYDVGGRAMWELVNWEPGEFYVEGQICVKEGTPCE